MCDDFNQHFVDETEKIFVHYMLYLSRPKAQRGVDLTAIHAANLNKKPGFRLIRDNLILRPDHRNTSQEISDSTKMPGWNGFEWARDEVTPRMPELLGMGLIRRTVSTRQPPSVGRSKKHAHNRVWELVPHCEWGGRAKRLLTPPHEWSMTTWREVYAEEDEAEAMFTEKRRFNEAKRRVKRWRAYITYTEDGDGWHPNVELPELDVLFGKELRELVHPELRELKKLGTVLLMKYAVVYVPLLRNTAQ